MIQASGTWPRKSLRLSSKVIDPNEFGVSFSLKQCRNFKLDGQETLDWLIKDAGFRRFRIMSYWNDHERTRGDLDWSQLDWQVKKIAEAGGEITFCLGARQPRWPENHWPGWAWELTPSERGVALLNFIQATLKRYRNETAIIGWQLENEAVLSNWGERAEVDRNRLRLEYALVKDLDPSRPIIMTTSTSWGIPIRKPIPDIVGFSYYHTVHRNGAYHTSTIFPWVHRMRKSLIKLLHGRPVFIHELQLEPWGPTAIWKMDTAEQDKSMDATAIQRNIELGKKIKAAPIDLWGGEWWYWRLKRGDAAIWKAVRAAILSTK